MSFLPEAHPDNPTVMAVEHAASISKENTDRTFILTSKVKYDTPALSFKWTIVHSFDTLFNMKYSIEFLIKMGDFLDGIDEVREKNEAGFNAFDKVNWQFVRGKSGKMAKLLSKYINTQLVPQFGEDAKKAIEEFKEKQPVKEFVKELAKNDFSLDEIFAKVEDVPVDPKISPAAAIDLIVKKKAKDLCVVRRIPGQKKFEFRFTYSTELNFLFGNRNGQLSGIVECNPQTWGRETVDLALVKEAIGKIKERLPHFTLILEDFDVIEREREKKLAEETAPIPELPLAPPYVLFPFQNEFVRFLNQTDGNALIGAEMGLGKTLITLAWLALNGKRALVVCPKVVRRNWVVEAQKFFPNYFKNVIELNPKMSGSNLSLFGEIKLASINFQSFHKFIPLIQQGLFDTLVIDESHNIKNPNAQITEHIHSVAHFFKHKILLSGTAIKNKKDELYTQIELIRPGMFESKNEVKMSTIGKLWHDIQDFYKTKSKHEVLKDLPDKLISIIEGEVKSCPDIQGTLSIEEVSRLKADIAIAKTSVTIDFVEELLESSQSCILVFSDSVEAAKTIADHFGEQAWLHRAQDNDDLRQKMKDDFDLSKNKEWSGKRVFVTTRQSCKEGATLTRADKVIFNDLPWTPADIRQAEDRAHRIGQKNNVNVYWMKAKGNRFDSKIISILRVKYDISKKILEGKQVSEEEKKYLETAVDLKSIMKD